MLRTNGFAFARIAAIAILLLGSTGCGSGDSTDATPSGTGADITFVDLPALVSALEEYRGEAVLLNFWAIWCVPCVAELPELIETGRDFAEKGGRVVTISYDLMIPGETRETALSKLGEFTASRDMDVPVLVFDAPDYDEINEHFGIPGPIPVTLAIDREGKIVDRQEGKAGKERFVEMMQRALL